MLSSSQPERLVTVIGDLVGSRVTGDRVAVQRRLNEVLDEVNALLLPVQPLEPTVGDEYQGAFADVADAIDGTLLVRLHLDGVIDVRAGIGVGEVTVHEPARRPVLQDGPGWWAARAAIDELAGRRRARTWYAGPDEREAGRLNAFLLARDQLVEHLNDRGRRILALALVGTSQKEIAAREGVYPSAVSQQFSRGVGAVVEAHHQLRREG